MKKAKKTDIAIWIVICCLLATGLSIFFFKYHPLTLFDTDDWTYLSFTRQSKLLPSRNEWNPTRVLPENLMPIAGYLGWALFHGGRGYYDATVAGMNIVLIFFIVVYTVLLVRMVCRKFNIDVLLQAVLAAFVIFVHFLPYVKGDAVYDQFFKAGNACCVFYYTIPTLLNAILICLMMIHEEYIRHFFRKEHVACKILLCGMLYFAVYSNLYSSIVIAAFASVKILQFFFVEARDYTTDRVDKLIQCTVYIYVLVLWFVSMIFEIFGGRADQLSGVKFDIFGSFKAYINTFASKNILYSVIIIASAIFYIVMLIHVLRNKDRYLKPFLDRLKATSKKKRDEAVMDEGDALLFSYVNQASLWMVCFVLTSAFLILLSAKTGSGYLGHIAVQLDYNLFLLMNVYMALAYLMKRQKKVVFGVAACTALMAYMAVFGSGTYAEYNMRGYSNETCKALADYIVEQYVEADRSGVETAQIHVPDFGTEDNFPIANYGNMRIANTLYNYGVTSRFVMSEFVIDSTVNDRFGL